MPPIRERELIKPPVGHLLVLFIAVPVVELALLIEIGQRVGTVGTIGLIMGTGIVGAALARQQGISTLARLRADLDAGRWPAEPIVDGVLILVAAAVLITPGVLTDLAGFLCLVPACRQLLKRYLHQRFEGTTHGLTVILSESLTTSGSLAAPTWRNGPRQLKVYQPVEEVCLLSWPIQAALAMSD